MQIHRLVAAAFFAAACSSAPQDVRRASRVIGPEGPATFALEGGGSTTDLTGTGTAAIDGVLSPGEWDLAGSVDFAANVPASDGGGTVPARLYAMNDGVNLYFAIRFDAPFHGGASFVVEIDANGDGLVSPGDDALVSTGWPDGGQIFADDFRIECGGAVCAPMDTTAFGGVPAGTNDGAAKMVTSGGVTVSEIAHPLASGDLLHDVQAAPGDVVGFRVFVRNMDSCPSWPDCFGDTDFPAGGQVSMTIAGGAPPPPPPVEEPPPPPPPVEEPPPPFEEPPPAPADPITVLIDVKPTHVDAPAPIQLGARGTVPVAILGAPSFDVAAVEVPSVSFAGAPVASRPNGTRMASLEDVNGDGHPDLVLHFECAALLLASDASTAELTGTAAGGPFAGQDSIRIVP
jgi:hypothetical protein